MFSNNIRIYGKHSVIAKKYSRPTSSDEKNEPFTLIDSIGRTSDKINVYIFDTLLDCFMTAMMLGIVEDRTSDEDSDKAVYATVFTDILMKKRRQLERIYQHMVLTRYLDLDIDARVKIAFGIVKEENKKTELQNMKAYLLGGLEIIDEMFSNCVTVEDFCNKIIDFKNQYEIGQM